MGKRVLCALVVGATLTMAVAGTAAAGHTHVRTLGNGNGQCVIVAEQGGEERVILPDAVFSNNPNVVPGTYAPDRRHPLHVLVHIPGAGSGELYVLGSAGALANCDGYVND